MALSTIVQSFYRKAPTIGKGALTVAFDVILEDTLEAGVELSDYPLEVGVNSNDHRRIKPKIWTMTGIVSNNPLSTSVSDFTGAISELNDDDGVLSTSAGIMAGMLGDLTNTDRASGTLSDLLKLMETGDPFDVFCGDISLTNMVIANLRRTKNPENENTLVFIAELREWQDIKTAISKAGVQTNAVTGTDTASASSNLKEKGEKSLLDTATDQINSVLEIFNV